MTQGSIMTQSPSTTQDPTTSQEQNKLYKVWLAVGVFVIGILVISLIVLVVRNSQSQEIDPHTDIVLDTTPYAFFENHYILDQNLSDHAYQSVLADLQTVILDQAQIASAPYTNDPSRFSLPAHAYDAKIDPESFTRRTAANYRELGFTMQISDGRVYNVAIRAYGGGYENYYYGLVVYRADAGASHNDYTDGVGAASLNTGFAFIHFLLPGDADADSRADFHYNRDAAITGLTDWFATFPVPLDITVRNL